ncbi:hypothetical protein IKS57_00635 [bacterium]|nr:hypothetical protein [bacterium]
MTVVQLPDPSATFSNSFNSVLLKVIIKSCPLVFIAKKLFQGTVPISGIVTPVEVIANTVPLIFIEIFKSLVVNSLKMQEPRFSLGVKVICELFVLNI